MVFNEESEEGQRHLDNPSTNSNESPLKCVRVQSYNGCPPKDAEYSYNDELRPLVEKPDTEEKGFFKNFTIEPLMVAFMLSYVSRAVCNQNLLIDKACLYVFDKPSNICSNLDNYTQEKKEIEVYANNYNLYLTLVQTVPAVFFSMVIGPWSDKHGRKPPIIVALIGGFLENVGVMFNVIYFDAPMYYLLISAIPVGICGGLVSVILCVYSLASEQSSRKRRTIKYAFVELALGIGAPLGTLIGGLLYKQSGYLSVYIFSASFQLAAIPWVVFVIKDTRGTSSSGTNWDLISDLFCVENFKESFRTMIKPREKSLRMEMCLLVGSICTLLSTLIATSSFGFYFARWMYNFDVTLYSNVNTVFIASSMVLSVAVVIIAGRVLKLKNADVWFGLIGTASTVATNVGKSVAEKVWIYYVACTLGLLVGLAPLAVRSRLSKIVKEDELGKVFAFLSSCEALAPVMASVVLSQIFNASIDFFPGLAYTVNGAMALLPLGTFLWILRKEKSMKDASPA